MPRSRGPGPNGKSLHCETTSRSFSPRSRPGTRSAQRHAQNIAVATETVEEARQQFYALIDDEYEQLCATEHLSGPASSDSSLQKAAGRDTQETFFNVLRRNGGKNDGRRKRGTGRTRVDYANYGVEFINDSVRAPLAGPDLAMTVTRWSVGSQTVTRQPHCSRSPA